MKRFWQIPVVGTPVFFALTILSGHLWTTALWRTAVCAAVLTVVAWVGEWARRWMAEDTSSTIDLRSAPTEQDLQHLTAGWEWPPSPGKEEGKSETGPRQDTVVAEPESNRLPSEGGTPEGWTDLATWMQRRG
ncbi:MAG: hypothetical protein IRY98_06385 [Alicyclobacillaceae bacterium]|nr:hypothetical protein [Alicyclobacillaceae bacterium]